MPLPLRCATTSAPRRSGPRRRSEIYAAALEQFAWADEQRLRPPRALGAPRHRRRLDARAAHDGAASCSAHDRARARDDQRASILPLHDPVRIAEQIAVLDNAFPGRLWIVVRRGLPRRGVRDGRRRARGAGARSSRSTSQVMLEAWTGEPFEWRGRTVRVTPKPATAAAPDGARRRGRAGRGAAGGAAAAADAADEHRPGRARRVLRRGRRRSASTAAS